MLKYRLQKLISNYLYVCTVVFGTTLICLGVVELIDPTKSMSSIVLISFVINFVIIMSQMSKRYIIGYSINDLVWMFNLTFLCIAPFIQYSANNFPWWDTYIFTEQLVFFTNIMISVFMLVYILTYKFYNVKIKKIKKIKNIEKIIIITTVISFFCTLLLIRLTGFSDMFSRATSSTEIDNLSISLIVNHTVRMFPVISLAIQILYKNINSKIYKKNIWIISIILVIITNFPTAMARNAAAAVYIGLMVLFFKSFKNKYLFKYIIIFGLLFVFPLINIFRYNTFADLITANIEFPNPTLEFLTGNYDAFSMFSRSIFFVSQQGLSLGYQLLGALFFFIPRSIWPTKPIGSGEMIGSLAGWDFFNVSMPFIGEGYINFGFLGVILFSVVLAIFIKKLDVNFSVFIIDKKREINYINLAYPFIIGYIFFILRGALLSSVAYTIGSVVIPIIIIYIIDTILNICKK